MKKETIHKYYKHKPCSNCPFRKDCLKGWLGRRRITEILLQESFTCHRTEDPNRLQCAGFMLIQGESNQFQSLAKEHGFTLKLTGIELIFDTYKECIEHHSNI